MPETPLISRRFTLVEKEDYGIDLEYSDEFAIIHFPYVSKFNKGVLLDMSATLDSMKKFLEDMGYWHLWVAVEPHNKSTAKLAKRFGFKYVGLDQDTGRYDIYVLEGEE